MNENQMKYVADLIINLEKAENTINQLQSNWNSLRGIVEDYLKEYGYDYNELTMKKDIINVNGLWLKFILDKMNELEGKDKE